MGVVRAGLARAEPLIALLRFEGRTVTTKHLARKERDLPADTADRAHGVAGYEPREAVRDGFLPLGLRS